MRFRDVAYNGTDAIGKTASVVRACRPELSAARPCTEPTSAGTPKPRALGGRSSNHGGAGGRSTLTGTLASHRRTREEIRPTRSWRKAGREAQRGRGFGRAQRFLKRVSRTTTRSNTAGYR
jgi:hypothetical protein